MRLLYQKASFDNVSEIMGLIQGAILNMEKHGIYQWDKLYHTEEVLLCQDLAQNKMRKTAANGQC